MNPLNRREQQIWNFIAERLRLGSAPTVREIAVHCALRSTNAVHRHLKAMANKGYLKREARTSRGLQVVDPTAPAPKSTTSIPVYGVIPSGPPDKTTQTPEHYLTVDLETLGIPRTAPRLFALRVKDGSMERAGILEGDWAIIEHGKEPRSGCIVAAYVDGKSTLRRYLVRQGKPYVQSENSHFAEQVPCEELTVEGVMIGLYRKG